MSKKATINYAYFVDNVSRKFTLRQNKCSLQAGAGPFTPEPARFMGGSVRKYARFGFGLEQKNVMFLRFNPRTSGASSDETIQRGNFSKASKLANSWAKNLAVIPTITAAWKDPSNGSSKGVYKQGYTLRGWMFAVAYAVILGGGSESSEWPGYEPAK